MVRRLVRVNLAETAAIKKILSEKGLTARKVAVLCGVPDWPTSVLAGTFHAIGFIAPLTLAGALAAPGAPVTAGVRRHKYTNLKKR
ncbi:hypothetical protein T492DRAFT_991138 [Pavlovales sp. CCMP2436]|nr:hypothetical protein T492DRAFT_991138 [Pavlovales sp. CCMP2436]